MGLRSIILVGIAAVAFEKVYAQDDSQPSLVNAPITTIYTPKGFDDNDTSQIIVEGEFPNTCYKVGPARIKAERDEQKITFQLLALKYKGACLEVRTPFVKVIDVGILPEGRYQVVSAGGTAPAAVLGVHHTESRLADDFLYAPVDAAFIHKGQDGERRLLTISGAFPNSCMAFPDDPGAMIVKMTARNLIEILPVVEMKQGPCLSVMVPFTKTVLLNENIPSGKFLVHVRTLNGQSYNKVDFIGADPITNQR